MIATAFVSYKVLIPNLEFPLAISKHTVNNMMLNTTNIKRRKSSTESPWSLLTQMADKFNEYGLFGAVQRKCFGTS